MNMRRDAMSILCNHSGVSPSVIPIENYVHETVMLGIGHLEEAGPRQTFDLWTNYPVVLCELLAVLYLSSLFEQHSWTTTQARITEALCTTHHFSLGFKFEEVVLLVLLHMFGGEARPLSDAFHSDQPWASRKVTLVSLKHRLDGGIKSSPVSWITGSSDHFGSKATSPAEILEFLDNPNGKCFLISDNHMGPGLWCFLQDETNKELILLVLHRNIPERLTSEIWLRALDSGTPEVLYQVKY
jgi:hypothetical protein